MRWLKSTTQKSWVVDGLVIPPCITQDNRYLKIEDSKYTAISKKPVIASLIKAGAILVCNQEPAELKNSMTNLQSSNAQLTARNTELEARVKELEAQAVPQEPVDIEAIKTQAVEELKAEAIKELQEKDDEIARLKKELKAAEKAAKKAEKADD